MANVNDLLVDKASTSALSDKQDKLTLASSLTVAAITLTRTISCNQVIARYFETGTTAMTFKVCTNTDVMSLTASLIRLYSPVQIDQGCKTHTKLSLGYYSPSNPNL